MSVSASFRWVLRGVFMFLACAVVSSVQAQESRPPTVQILSPVEGDIVRGTINVEVAVLTDLGGPTVTHVDLLVFDKLYGRLEYPTDRAIIPLDTLYLPNNFWKLSARAVDEANKAGVSPPVEIQVQNNGAVLTKIVAPSPLDLPAKGAPPDRIRPWVVLTTPDPGYASNGTVKLEAFAVDNTKETGGIGIAAVEFYEGRSEPRRLLGRGGSSTTGKDYYFFNWVTTAADDGERFIVARARDNAGNVSDPGKEIPVRVLVDHVRPSLHAVRAGPDVFVQASPAVLRDGSVTLYALFEWDHKVTGMDRWTPPRVRVHLPNGRVREATTSNYFAERWYWIGTVDVSRPDDGEGTAVIEVDQAKDLAGNVMAPVARAGYIQIVAANPRWPVPNHTITNNVGMTYGWGAGNFRIHEGVDMIEAVSTRVTAARGGRVVYVQAAAAAPNRAVTVEVQVGTDAAGHPILEYDNYLHMHPVNVAVGDHPGVGALIGQVGNNFGNFNHMHLQYGYSRWAVHYVTPFHNPLFLFAAPADRDPQLANPGLFDGDGDGRTVYVLRQGDGTQLATPGAPVYGPLRLLGEFSDQMNYFVHAYPLEVGYWIRPQQAVGRRVKNSRAPYLLSHWFEYDVVLDNAPQVRRYVETAAAYRTTWRAPVPPGNYPPPRYHHALLTNAADVIGNDGNRQNGQFWNSRARPGRTALWSCDQENGSDCRPARVNAEAMFPDGSYRIEVVASDLRFLMRSVGTHDVIVDNFAPHLLRVKVEQGDGRTRLKYSAHWELNGAGNAQQLLPAAAERNPSWINNKADVIVRATFSEPLRTAPTLLLKKTDGSTKLVPMVEAPLTRQRAWTATIAAGDADLQNHRIDSEPGADFGFQGQDLAGNELDTNPATIGVRTAATGAFAGYEHALAADWGNRVVDHNYRIRVDTKHDDKPEAPNQLKPGR